MTWYIFMYNSLCKEYQYISVYQILFFTFDLVLSPGHPIFKFQNSRMVVTSSFRGTKCKVSLVSNSSTFDVCMFCNKRYLTERGLNHHLQRYCKHATDHRNRKQEHLGTILQHNIEDDPSIREDINISTNANSFCFGIEPAEDSLISSIINNPRPSSIRRPNNEEELIDQHHGEESASTYSKMIVHIPNDSQRKRKVISSSLPSGKKIKPHGTQHF